MVTLSRSSLNTKKIGIWGLGTSGQNLIAFLKNYTPTLYVLEKEEIIQKQVPAVATIVHKFFLEPSQRDDFFRECDLIIPSPGIALPQELIKSPKICSELDLYMLFNATPTIAITGSLGKTSITTLITTLLNKQQKPAIAGGNIGNGIIQTINQTKDYTVLELSSFQLEHTHTFRPKIALITNIYANHLDRHKTMQEYTKAKLNICKNQKPEDFIILPTELAEQYSFKIPGNGTPIICGPKPQTLPPNFIHIQYDKHGNITSSYQGEVNHLVNKEDIPLVSFPTNWLFIAAVFYCLQSHQAIKKTNYPLPPHRMENLGEKNGIRYINDSKSTVMESTIAACNTCPKKQTILFLGGLSKGVDRTPYLAQLAGVHHIICFGQEAQHLATACSLHSISASTHKTLEEAWDFAQSLCKPNMTILFSPGGSSYDLFTDYQIRGNSFKELVLSA